MVQQRLIYGLIDPRTDVIRYVGSSTKGLLRPNEHLRPCAYENSHRKVYRWIRDVIADGQRPQIVVLDHVRDDENLFKRETKWIKFYRRLGVDLTNSTGSAAGTGMTGKKHSEQTRVLISAKKRGSKLSLQSRLNIGKASKSRGISRKTIEAATIAKLGKPRSEATKEKIRSKLAGVKQTEERRRVTSERMKKWWEERRGRI